MLGGDGGWGVGGGGDGGWGEGGDGGWEGGGDGGWRGETIHTHKHTKYCVVRFNVLIHEMLLFFVDFFFFFFWGGGNNPLISASLVEMWCQPIMIMTESGTMCTILIIF